MKRFVASTVSLCLFFSSAGLRAGQAFAAVIAHGTPAGPVGVVSVPIGAAPAIHAAVPSLTLAVPVGLPSVLPTTLAQPTLRPVTAVPSAVAAPIAPAVVAQAAAVLLPAAAFPVKAAAPAQAQAAKSAAPVTVAAMAKQAAAAVAFVGPVSQAAPSDAHALGGRLEEILGAPGRFSAAASAVAPEGGDWGPSGASRDRYFGKPAGADSIAGAVRSHNARFGTAQTPVAASPVAEAARAPRQAPFFPKLISAGLALAPALALGLPLLGAGLTLAGGAVLAASAALMALPFMGEKTPAALRAVPGVLLFGLGALTLAAAFTGGASLWAGAFVALGGWGLYRYGVKTGQEDRFDREKALSAYFGAIGAVALAGLALAGSSVLLPAWGATLALAGAPLAFTAATWTAYPLTVLLFLHLPGWVGEGISAALRSVYTSGRAVHRVLGSMKRDTVLYDRLLAFTKRHLQSSPWNAIWLSGIWIPVWLSEAAMAALSVAAGLAFGAAMAPTMFLWGAVNKLWQKSAANRFLAAWNHFAFDWAQGSKIGVYNRATKPLIAYVNTTRGPLGLAASTGLRLAQLAWLVYAALAFPVTWAVGFFRAFGKTAGDYVPQKHSPDYLRVDTNDKPDVERPNEPEDPTKPGKSTLAPRLIASAIAALPLYFLALPLLAVPFLGQLYALTGLALVAMPFLPAGAPKWAKRLPGALLLGLGLLSSVAVPYFTFGGVGILAMLSENSMWMSLVTLLSGWGLIRYAGSLEKKDGQKWYSVDDPEYIGAFFGAVGVLTGLGVSLLGLTGWIPLAFKVGGYLTSLLLLMHLPRWVGEGLRASFDGLWGSARAFSKVFSFWENDTDFYKNLRRHASYWLDKSVWNGTWLSVIWVPTAAVALAEFAAAAVLGLAFGLARLPLNFVWGAAYNVAPDAKLTRFIAGFARGSFDRAEGSKKSVFDRWAAPLTAAMSEANPTSGRPTLKAALAFLAARFVQLAWLARLVFCLPAVLVLSAFDGAKNAAGEKPKPGEGEWHGDKDRPGGAF